MSGHDSEKERGWLLPAPKNSGTGPGLYLVSTPIGNLGDITLRALDILASCDRVICEDTRVSGKLLSHFGIKKPLIPYNDHNAGRQRESLLKMLRGGQALALISDAGTPLISDPGYKLVQECLKETIPVTSLPGANAVLPALQLSGLPGDSFCFLGFLPAKQTARRKYLAGWKSVPSTLVAYETAPRLADSLKDIAEILGDRAVAVLRELTKLHEEARRGTVSELIAHYERNGPPKGEIVLVIGKSVEQGMSDDVVRKQLGKCLKTMGTREAASVMAALTGRPRKEIYALALEISKNG